MTRGRRGVLHKQSSGMARPSRDVPYIPMDALAEILIRTSAQDLVRFKGVCKAWYELISRMSFAESHAEHWRSRPVSRILFNGDTPVNGRTWKMTKSDIFYSSNVNHMGSITRTRPRRGNVYYRVRCHSLLTSRQRAELGCGSKELTVLASCDGLVLICYEEITHCQPLIYNPVTGSYKKLPVFKPIGDQVLKDISSRYEWAMLRAASGHYKVCGIERWGAPMVCYILELQIGTKEQPERHWKKLMAPLSGEWSIQATTTTKDGKVHWLATRWSGWAARSYTLKVLSLDILKEEFSASISVQSRLCELDGPFFPWKGAFFYHTGHMKDEPVQTSLWVLEDFDTMTRTEYGNFQLSNYDFIYLSGERPVIGDNKLLLGSHGINYVFDLISKEFWSLDIDSRGSSLGRINVLHTDSLIGCN